MDQERAVKKLRFNVEQGHISLEDALSQAYAAGFDGKVKVNGCQRKVEVYKDGRCVMRKDSVGEVARALNMERHVVSASIKKDRLTKRGYYFRYADKKG